jgi:hypothetical protein
MGSTQDHEGRLELGGFDLVNRRIKVALHRLQGSMTFGASCFKVQLLQAMPSPAENGMSRRNCTIIARVTWTRTAVVSSARIRSAL